MSARSRKRRVDRPLQAEALNARSRRCRREQSRSSMKVAKLALEDGTVFTGTSFGAQGEVDGEVCFNTSMTGYQEILTDPSYRGQIVTMTYPEIGNYGVNAEDVESGRAAPGRLRRPQSQQPWPATFAPTAGWTTIWPRHGIVGISGIDTRALVRRIRQHGALEGRAVDRRSGRRQPGGQGQGQPRPGRPRPGARGRARASRASGTSG